MAYTYSGNPEDSELDRYRFLIGDIGDTVDATPTDATPTTSYNDDPRDSWILSDEEVMFILNNFTLNNVRLYYLFNSCASILSKQIKRSLGPQSEDPTTRATYYIEQAAFYKKVSSMAGLSLPVYSMDKIFTKGMHDNV